LTQKLTQDLSLKGDPRVSYRTSTTQRASYSWIDEDDEYISEIYNNLPPEEHGRASVAYISPDPLTRKSYNAALKAAMVKASCWPFSIKNITESGAEEYEEIMTAQDIMDRSC